MTTVVINKRSTSVNLESDHLVIHHHELDELGDDHARVTVPLAQVERMVVYGQPSISFPTLARLMKKGIPCAFLSEHGRWRGGVGIHEGYFAERRMLQYSRIKDDTFALLAAKKLIEAKIANGRRVIQRLLANRKQSETSEQGICRLHMENAISGLEHAETVDEVRGLEGIAAAYYFESLRDFFPESMPFEGRNRRPPKDPANAVLSWTYSIVLQEVIGCLRSHGLDDAGGVLHSRQDRSPSLALDLLEPLRTGCCDLIAINLANHRILRPNDHFAFSEEDGGVYLNAYGRAAFFKTYEQTMRRKFLSSQIGHHVDLRQVIDFQVCQFLKLLDGDASVSFFSLP